MQEEGLKILEFLDEFAKKYKHIEFRDDYLETLQALNLSQTECIYVIDFSKNKMTFANGFESFVGYKDEKMSLGNYLEKIHPDDIDLVGRIGAATMEHTHSNPNNNKDNVLYISFRIRKSNNEYIKVLSQSSVFEIGQEGQMISSLVKVSDLSFIEDGEVVRYKFVAENLDQEAFKYKIYHSSKDLFTNRELDIIKEIAKGKSSQDIAESLEISKHTVATHRKKIMKKSGCHSAEELLKFCKRNGVL
ncbi:LuxR C-terminal-related transcriptional regulator [Lutimonas halocynthiae]|uniref:response regulator transcription factor n=1 Tax=Lutimonas halocynthiae TaxID=1446477 RepID=UPI0025B44D9A|nr:LuxR C-terminal-related transcriptional regulator [Lutimonas halocynthiae]MDN3641078.1 LuxR C-terminal-related transcriptional regulator [Lutimonas halocynthiae]